VKRFSGQSTYLCDGDLSRMANNINIFMRSVSNDLKQYYCLHAKCVKWSETILISSCGVCQMIWSYSTLIGFLKLVMHAQMNIVLKVESKLSRIDSHESSGPDELPNWFLKEFSVFWAEPVCSIFNASIRNGIIMVSEWVLCVPGWTSLFNTQCINKRRLSSKRGANSKGEPT